MHDRPGEESIHASERSAGRRGGGAPGEADLSARLPVSSAAAAAPLTRFAALAPGLTAAVSFSATDILIKVVYASGMDTLTLVSLRGMLVVAFFWWWLRLVPPVERHSPRARLIAIGLGLLFAGTMFGLLKAFAMLPVSIAILAYFIYPLLTGIAGAVTGVERLGWRAMVTAIAAFAGLGLMLAPQFTALAPVGLLCAFAAAVCRVISLLATRAWLAGTDARLTTWYSMVPSTLLFVALSLGAGTWHTPQTMPGWLAFAAISVCSTLSTLMIYISTNRIGPFRTALIMNLEPLLTTIMSLALLGEVLSPVQAVGAAVMIGSLCGFQFLRGR